MTENNDQPESGATPPVEIPEPVENVEQDYSDLKKELDLKTAEIEKWKTLSRKNERRPLTAIGFSDEEADKLLEGKSQTKASDVILERIATLENRVSDAEGRANLAQLQLKYQLGDGDIPLFESIPQDKWDEVAKRIVNVSKSKTTEGLGIVGSPIAGEKQWSKEDYAKATISERVDARQKGALKDLFGIEK
jgi:hypothetical protein